MKKCISTVLLLGLSVYTYAERLAPHGSDSVPPPTATTKANWIAPGLLFSTGMSIAAIPKIRKIDTTVYNGFKPGRTHTRIDDYTQYLPALTVFALDAAGLKGKSNPKQQIVQYGASFVTASVVVQSMKRIVGRERPYGDEFNSFPSGHTSTAFVAAEFLHQEFGHLSPWISVAGYATATATGYLRLYNNEHWLADVLAGAAIGMASTKLIYWIKKQKRPRKALLKM